MKTLFRLGVILLVCLAITGGAYAIGQSPWATQQTLGRFERSRGAREFGEREADERVGTFRSGESFRSEGDREAFGGERSVRGRGLQLFSVRIWLGFTRTLVPIALIITIVTLFTKAVKRRRHHRGTSPTPA
ncbi:MAG: hypothetical protein R3E79_24850 [Caldilineaceae bacterium]